MSRVFVPQMPSRFDTATNLWIPTVNIAPARRFGGLIVILPPAANRASIDVCANAIAMAMSDFNEDDYLVALGDPTLYAIAACVAASHTKGLLRMLKWDRMELDYLFVEVQV